MTARPPAGTMPYADSGDDQAFPDVATALKNIRDLPSLPVVIQKLMTMMQDPQVPASRVSELISYDPGLASRVLRMVNSSAFGFQRQITSIQHGMMILGFNSVRGIVLSASVLKLFEGKSHSDGLDHEAFWWHSTATAVTAKLLAERLRMPHLLDDAFTAGMLHDMGKLVLDVYFRDHYKHVLEDGFNLSHRCHGKEFFYREEDILGATHTEVGAELGARWKLPVPIQEVMRSHHTPTAAPTEHRPLVMLIALANAIAAYLAKDVPSRIKSSVLATLPDGVLDYLKLDEDQVKALANEAEDSIEAIGHLFYGT